MERAAKGLSQVVTKHWWCPACNDAISQIFISFQCLALIFVVTEKLAQDVDKKWFFEKGVVTGRALPKNHGVARYPLAKTA